MDGMQLLDVLDLLANPRILVLGDLILDRYTWGNAERISQEAPVMVLRADRQEHRLGGAANVCHMLRALEADVSCLGVVGDDPSGQMVRQLMDDLQVDGQELLTDPRRPTTQKERFVGRAASRHPSQMLRVDTEITDPVCGDIEEELVRRVSDRIATYDAVLVSDYAKGVCTPRLLAALIEAARAAGVPVLVDPGRGRDFRRYRGATLIKPNRLETAMVSGTPIDRPEEAFSAGRRMCRELDLPMAVVTLDRDGMALVQRDGPAEIYSTHARSVYDITGAGDMVLAVLGLCFGARVSPAQAVQLANVAAGLEVERHGVAVIRRDEIRRELLARSQGASRKQIALEPLAARVAEHRHRGQRIVFTNGCFDLLHVGHVRYLEEAAALGDVLVVGVNSDASVRKLKGAERPVIGETDRAAMLASLACVDHVVVFDEDTPHRLLHVLRPDVLVKGGTYAPHEVVGHEVVQAYGGKVCVTGVTDGISTTHIVESIARHAESPEAERRQAPNDEQATSRLRRAG